MHFLMWGYSTPTHQATATPASQPCTEGTSKPKNGNMVIESAKLKWPHSLHWSLLPLRAWAEKRLLPTSALLTGWLPRTMLPTAQHWHGWDARYHFLSWERNGTERRKVLASSAWESLLNGLSCLRTLWCGCTSPNPVALLRVWIIVIAWVIVVLWPQKKKNLKTICPFSDLPIWNFSDALSQH